MDIELRHLRYFVAVAEEAGFTAAAGRAHVTQQVLSAQVRQLEDAVGTPLLSRTGRGVVLTAAGSAFLDVAREMLSSLDRGVAAARNAARAVAGRLVVGLSAATGGLVRTQVLAAGHRLASRSSLDLAEVAGLPWVAAPLSVDGCVPSVFRDDWLAAPRPGGGVPVVGAEARTIEEWREYVVAGRGIGLCPASAEAFSARPGTVFVPARGVPPTSLCVAWRADDLRPAVLAFAKVAASVAAGAGAAGAAGAGAAGAAGAGVVGAAGDEA